MALFPRRIGGKYVMLSRRDRENLHLATSTDVGHWADVTELHRPSTPWELLQIGNCGSPIETDAGWLVITHGVGPMRRYVLGALLLDLEDPAAGDRPAARAAARARSARARRLRAERRLLVRRDAQRRRSGASLRAVRRRRRDRHRLGPGPASGATRGHGNGRLPSMSDDRGGGSSRAHPSRRSRATTLPARRLESRVRARSASPSDPRAANRRGAARARPDTARRTPS